VAEQLTKGIATAFMMMQARVQMEGWLEIT
jgi:hypothetical protein